MRIPVLVVGVLAAAVAAGAQCPVAGDAACTTPDTKAAAVPGAAKSPSDKSSKPAQKPGHGATAASAPTGQTQAAAKTPAQPAAAVATNGPAESSITRSQADAILVELKDIHALLQKQQPATPPVDFSKLDFNSFPVVKLASDGRWDNAVGKDDAPITIVEFSDYQCSHCAKFHSGTFEAIKKKYIESGQVRFVSRDLPLVAFHPWAMVAAEASRCAGEQNKYWEMRTAMMLHSDAISPEVIEQSAQAIPLNMELYHACTESRKYYTAVRDDIQAASSIQIPGTPGFVIGKSAKGEVEGKRVMGARPLSDFEKLIDEALAAKQ